MTFEPGESLWSATSGEAFAAPPLDRSISVDLAVIGGGFTGTSAALDAAGRGASVALLEARRVGHGGSGRNVGLVNAGLWLPPDEIVATLGEAVAARLIDILSDAPGEVFRRIEAHDIACEPVRNGTLHCAHSRAGLRNLERRLQQGVRRGAPIRLLDSDETRRRTGTGAYHGALFDPRAGTIQPLAYVRGLARAARKAGAQIFEKTQVSGLARVDGTWRVNTGAAEVRAGAVIVATNAYHLGVEGPFRPGFVPVGYSQFATAPLHEVDRRVILPGAEGCWDTALVMTSFRIDRAGRLILGAIGDRDGPARAIHDAWARRKLGHLFPRLGGAAFEHVWRGTIAMTSDHVPKIVAFGPGGLACFGYSGRGIAPGTVFGAAMSRALLSGKYDDLPLPPVQRHGEPFAGLRAGYYEAGAALGHLIDAGRFG